MPGIITRASTQKDPTDPINLVSGGFNQRYENSCGLSGRRSHREPVTGRGKDHLTPALLFIEILAALCNIVQCPVIERDWKVHLALKDLGDLRVSRALKEYLDQRVPKVWVFKVQR
ncbi:uncharacterized protein LOC143157295 [Aptenodytes patagonicus]|uniref:uncharacterized protein LOC143157295 n=1 Tax=Aptenodytes patagonicus TaxID=9234 RepID=UPI003F9F092C